MIGQTRIVERWKKSLKTRYQEGSTGRWLLWLAYHYPLSCFRAFLASLLANKQLTGRFLPLVVRLHPNQRLRIRRHPSACVIIQGILTLEPWGGLEDLITISVGKEARLELGSDFVIGAGTHISVSTGASLYIGGRELESASGITCRTRIMVEKELSIGADCIIAWNVFITDSDWHSIEGRPRALPVRIGKHVWITHDTSIIKGAEIADGCIVAPKSVVSRRHTQANSLLAGIPAIEKRENVRWSR